MAGPSPRSAFEDAVRLLASRARTRRTLAAHLGRKGHSEADIEAALTRAQELGYLDDARYARTRAEALLQSSRWAPSSVVARLVAEGLPEPDAEAAVSAAVLETGFDLVEAGRALLARRHLSGPRAARLLTQHGFPEELVAKLVAPWRGEE